jgi:hypothetical protein
MQHSPARIAEKVFDLFFLQAPDYNLGTGYLHLLRLANLVFEKRVTLSVRPRLVKAKRLTACC